MTEKITSVGVEIPLSESGYGSGQHQVVVLSAKSKRALKQFIHDHRYLRTHEGDRPGEVYARGLQCLRYVKSDGDWQAVCISSTYWDV